ncbi:hypothetical protein [Sena Madureira virus]|uniref:Uncharacterized protein n=1 Tax=Sena Madureira virus TaxID=1272957 RepID=A0A0D3R1B5_9RHAB|nr:hypothetical protein [Sena Madureira virus]AJR28443.1 hypothetical protein [Sena Madureira virus]
MSYYLEELKSNDVNMEEVPFDTTAYNTFEVDAIPEGLPQWEIKRRQIDNILGALSQLGVRCDYLTDDVNSIRFYITLDPQLYSYEVDPEDNFIIFENEQSEDEDEFLCFIEEWDF